MNARSSEKTPKSIKAQFALSLLTLIAGGIVLAESPTDHPTPIFYFGAVLCVWGFIWYVAAQLYAWWQRG